ncbi:MAG: glycosyltransferase [Acidimicrobiia bacterium]|nr:glycosyltransferase [Acidimicrobiia bacterium]
MGRTSRLASATGSFSDARGSPRCRSSGPETPTTSRCCHYAETFCIAAAEAQAAGCAIVTSRLGALPETVGDAGICIDGGPRSAAYQQAFVDACVALLIDDERWGRVSGQAFAHQSREGRHRV